ncbi:hypothetical protein TUSST3_25510 [Streptomyces sp. TUS-ST3]|nr:hypothetical protein TUSST3_25510 [Streptomyces sp. TUS-ST3]
MTVTVTRGAGRGDDRAPSRRSTEPRTARATSTVLASRTATTWISTCHGLASSGRVIRTPAAAPPAAGRRPAERSRSLSVPAGASGGALCVRAPATGRLLSSSLPRVGHGCAVLVTEDFGRGTSCGRSVAGDTRGAGEVPGAREKAVNEKEWSRTETVIYP